MKVIVDMEHITAILMSPTDRLTGLRKPRKELRTTDKGILMDKAYLFLRWDKVFVKNRSDGKRQQGYYTNLGFKCRIRFRWSFCFNQGENRRNSSAIPRMINAE